MEVHPGRKTRSAFSTWIAYTLFEPRLCSVGGRKMQQGKRGLRLPSSIPLFIFPGTSSVYFTGASCRSDSRSPVLVHSRRKVRPSSYGPRCGSSTRHGSVLRIRSSSCTPLSFCYSRKVSNRLIPIDIRSRNAQKDFRSEIPSPVSSHRGHHGLRDEIPFRRSFRRQVFYFFRR